MPIRTHRGRAAVYRRLWGWPLRSPKHLVGAVLILGIVVTAIGFVLPNPPPSDRRPSSQRVAAEQDADDDAPTPAVNASPPSVSVPRTPPAETAPDPKGLSLVEQWGKRWAEHPPGTDRKQWVDGLRPYTSDEFVPLMESVDPENVPASAINGPATSVRSSASSMDVRLPTNAGDITVQLIKAPAGWRVAGYDEMG